MNEIIETLGKGLVLSCIVVNIEQTAAINKDLIEKINGIMEEK